MNEDLQKMIAQLILTTNAISTKRINNQLELRNKKGKLLSNIPIASSITTQNLVSKR